MRKFATGLVLLAALLATSLATAGVALADDSDLSQWDEPTAPDAPVPRATPGPLPPDPTVLMISPAPEYLFRGGYGDRGGGVNVVMFIDAGANGTLKPSFRPGIIGVFVDLDVMGGQDGLSSTSGDIRWRGKREPIDRNRASGDVYDTASRYYWGYGADLDWVAGTQNDNFVKLQPVAILGTMRAFRSRKTKEVKCVIHAFAKAGVGIFDNQVDTTSERKWGLSFDTWLRPMAGAEFMANCQNLDIIGNVRLIADAQHIFTLGPAGDTNRGRVQFSEVWNVKKRVQMGYFTKGEIVQDSDGVVPAVFGGLEARY